MTGQSDHPAQVDAEKVTVRDVALVSIKLTVIIDKANELVEWKVVSLQGPTGRMIGMLQSQPTLWQDPAHQHSLMSAALLSLLEQHCEPF